MTFNRFSSGTVGGRLAGKVALVTGAGGGQGQEVALLFARAGATVVASDIGEAGVTATAELAAAHGLAIDMALVDAADEAGVNQWVADAATRHGGIDILYNNAAHTHFAPFAEMSVTQWRETLRLELDVVFLPTHAVWPHMIERGGGSIVNIASVSGMRASEALGAAAHAAGKGGVLGFTSQLALEGAPHWIRVNAISPGPILTTVTAAMALQNKAFSDRFNGWPMLARTGRPIDVAYAGLFLASDEASFITGANLTVDGGWSAKGGFTPH